MAKFKLENGPEDMKGELSIYVKTAGPALPSVPLQPLILDSEYEYALFEHIRRFPRVLKSYRYEDQGQLLATIEEKVIAPAEAKVEEIRTSGR
jgi:hypothetical protein